MLTCRLTSLRVRPSRAASRKAEAGKLQRFVGGILAVVVVAVLIVGYSSLFTIYQTQQALVIRLGGPRPPVPDPGLPRRARFIDSVVYIDKAQFPPGSASERGDRVGSETAGCRCFCPVPDQGSAPLLPDTGLNHARIRSCPSCSIGAASSARRGHIYPRRTGSACLIRWRVFANSSTTEATGFGIEVVDVRIRRADLPKEQRRRSISACRLNGSAKRLSSARRARSARRKSAREPTGRLPCSWPTTSKIGEIRGEGDATRNQIFADAFQSGSRFSFAFSTG